MEELPKKPEELTKKKPWRDMLFLLIYLTIGLTLINSIQNLTPKSKEQHGTNKVKREVNLVITEDEVKISQVKVVKNEVKRDQIPVYPKYSWHGPLLIPAIVNFIFLILAMSLKFYEGSVFKKANFLGSAGIIISIILPIFFIGINIVPIVWSVILTILVWSFAFIDNLKFISDKISNVSDIEKIRLLHEEIKTWFGHGITICLTLGIVVATMMTILWTMEEYKHLFSFKYTVSIIIVVGLLYSYLGIAIWVARYVWKCREDILAKI